MKYLLVILVSLLLAGCATSIVDVEESSEYIYYYDWTNPKPFVDNQGGGDGLWFNSVRNRVLEANAWTTADGYVKLDPMFRAGAYSYLVLNKPGSTAGVTLGFKLSANTTVGKSGTLKVVARGDSLITLKVFDLSAIENGSKEYTLPMPSSWRTVDFQVNPDSIGFTPELRLTNVFLK